MSSFISHDIVKSLRRLNDDKVFNNSRQSLMTGKTTMSAFVASMIQENIHTDLDKMSNHMNAKTLLKIQNAYFMKKRTETTAH